MRRQWVHTFLLIYLSLCPYAYASKGAQGDDPCHLFGFQAASQSKIDAILAHAPAEISIAASKLSVTSRSYIGRLVDEYTAISYSESEIVRVVNDMMRMVRDKSSSTMGNPNASKELDLESCAAPSYGSGDRLLLFVDPVCSYCSEVSELVLRLRKNCPQFVPAVVFKLAPSSDPVSQKTAYFLESIRINNRDAYCPALLDAMKTLHSGDEDGLSSFMREYKPLSGIGQHALGKITESSALPPYILYRGTLIRRVGMFNPFATSTNLMYAIRTVQALDGTAAPGGNKRED